MVKRNLDDQMDQIPEDQYSDNQNQLQPNSNRVTTQPSPEPPRRASDYPAVPATAASGQSDPDGRSTGMDDRAWFYSLTGGEGSSLTPEQLQALGPQLAQRGFSLAPSANGKTQKIRSPNGMIIDVIQGADSGVNRAQWLQPDQQGGGGGAVGSAAAGGAGAGGSMSSQDPAVHDAIMRLLARGEKPVTEGDVQDQFAPVSRQYDRGAQHSREQSAERLAQQGLNLGGSGGQLDTEVNSINEKNTEAKGGLMAQLVTQELQGRRQDVANALQLAQGEEKTALSLELAQIDKEIRQASLGIQQQQVGNQQQQFYDQMGYNMGRDQYLFNQIYGQGLGAGI